MLKRLTKDQLLKIIYKKDWDGFRKWLSHKDDSPLDKLGTRLIHAICKEVKPEYTLPALDLLNEYGFDLHVSNELNHNAFHYLVLNKSMEVGLIVDWLVAHKVDINQLSTKNESPLDLSTYVRLKYRRDNIDVLDAAYIQAGATSHTYKNKSVKGIKKMG